MRIPTAAQLKVLKALQNQSVEVSAMLAEATLGQQRTGQSPPQSWYEEFHHRSVLREELTNAAHASGLPRAWTSHVRDRGDRGVRYRADLYLRTPEPIEWDRILTDLDADVQRIRGWAALDVAYQSSRAESDTAGMSRNLHTLRSRTAGVANLLGLTAEQGHRLWGTVDDWAQVSAESFEGVALEGIAQRWHHAARTDTTSYGLQATALARAGIRTDSAAALSSPTEFRDRIAAAFTAPQLLFRAAGNTGNDIEAAIGATNLSYNLDHPNAADTDAPLFSDQNLSHAFDPELVGAEHVVATPHWQEPGL